MPLAEQFPGLVKIFEALDQGIAVFDKHLKLIYINPAMKGVTGGNGGADWSLRDMLDKHQLRDIHGKPVPTEKFPIMLAFSGKETLDQRFEYVDINGHHTWLSVTCKRILDSRGQLEYVFTTIRNISRRRSNESKLQFLLESAKILGLTTDFRERLKEKAKLAVPELADLCVMDVLVDGEVERVAFIHKNPAVVETLRESENTYPPNPDSPTNSKKVIENHKPIFIPLVSEHVLRQIGGTEGRIEQLRKMQLKSVMVIPITVRGKGLGAMTLAYSDSGRMYTQEDFEFFQEFCYHLGVLFESSHFLEEIQRRDKSKDIFIATLSHELRNPLSPIKSALELMQLQSPPEHMKEELAVIEHNVDHLARLLNDLLDVTRFTRGMISIEQKPIDVRNTLTHAVKSMHVLVGESAIEMKLSVPDMPVMVLGDATRLEQAIMNLLSNAVKFTPRGGQITAELSVKDEEVRISIKDTGIGISSKDLSRIFDMFYQAERSKHVSGGLGIGLLLVDSIARLHGGSVQAKSKGLQKGSEFIVRLPLIEQVPISEGDTGAITQTTV